jgi:RNA polymerase sigma-70 factor, ECF subfamily
MEESMQDFAEQVAAQRPMLVRIARQRLRNDAWAEDAVSDTMVAALEKPGSFAGRAAMRTWLVGILKHKVVDQIRRHTRECQSDEPLDEPALDAQSDSIGQVLEVQADWDDPQERLSRRQFMAQFDACLKKLPPQQGRAFVLRNCMEEETDVICSQLGVTANNLGVILHRARNHLRASLQAQWLPLAGSARIQAGA